MRAAILSCIALAVYVDAQTITSVNALGQTIIEVVTVDPIAQTPTTTTLQTLTAAVTTTSTPTTALATTATTTAVQQGPVGQPAATGVQTPTVYTYTTVNANGVTTAIIDTFTPTFYQSAQSPVLSSGTVLDYSSWLSMIGTNTGNAQAAQATSGQLPLLPAAWYGVLGAVSGVLGGAWLVMV